MKRILIFMALMLFTQSFTYGQWDNQKTLEVKILNTARANMSDSTDIAKTAAGDSARAIIEDSIAALRASDIVQKADSSEVRGIVKDSTLTFRENDGTPSRKGPRVIVFSNGTLTATVDTIFVNTAGGASTGNPDSLGGLPSDDYATKDTARSIASDTADAVKNAMADSSVIRSLGISSDSLVYLANDRDWKDMSGRGNNGTATNVTMVSDTVANGFYSGSFNGTSSNVAIGNPLGTADSLTSATLASGGITVGGWFKLRSTANQQLINDYNSVASLGWYVNHGATTGFAAGFFRNGTNYKETHVGSVITDSTAYQWVVSQFFTSGAQPKLWVNGVEDTTTSNLGTTAALYMGSSTVKIGIRSNTATAYLNGNGDLVFIFSRLLSVEEIREMQRNTNPNPHIAQAVANIDSIEVRALHVTGPATLDSSLVVTGSARADTFITTSEKAISPKAVERVKQIKFKAGTEHGNYAELDHSSLPVDMQATIQERYYKDRVTGEEYSRKVISETVAARTVSDVQIVDGIAGPDTVDIIREVATGNIFASPKDYLEKRFRPITKEETGLNLNRYIFELGRAIELINARQDSIVNAMVK